MHILWIGLAGFVGAVARVWVAERVATRSSIAFPWGILLVNVSGAFALGLLGGLAPPPEVRLAVGTGFLGAYTTFSTLMVDTVRLRTAGQRWAAVANLAASTAAGVLAAWAGIRLGEAL